MNAADARSIAGRWVAEEASRTRGELLGAFTWGSVNWMAAEEPFPETSDLDLAVVVPLLDPERHRVRKSAYAELVIEPFYLPSERFGSTERLLADCAVAPNLVDGTVLLDPGGRLQGLRAEMAPELGRRRWVRLRCRDRRDQALSLVVAFETSESLAYLNGVCCAAVLAIAQMALIADLRNPTVKKALLKARDVLAAYGRADEHRALLRLLGGADLRDEDVLAVASHCRAALEEACRWLRTPFPPDNLVGMGTVAEARSRVRACRLALQRMTDVSDDIVSRNPRAFD